jgi:uncharacterized repeat protein (TIGR01451 family)
MAKPYLLFLSLFFTTMVSAQCEFTAAFSVDNAECGLVEVSNYSTYNCPEAVYTIHKIKYGYGNYDPFSEIGTFAYADSTMIYDGTFDYQTFYFYGNDFFLVSLTISAYDAAFNLISSDEVFQTVYMINTLSNSSYSVTPATDCFSNNGSISVQTNTFGEPVFVNYSSSDNEITGDLNTNGDGSFIINGLLPGSYWINMNTFTGCVYTLYVEVPSMSDELQGHVYADMNANGIYDSNEPDLASQHFYIPELDLNIYSNGNGEFNAGLLPNGTYNIQYVNEDDAYTMNNPLVVSNSGCYYIPLMPLGVPIFQVFPAYGSNGNIHCEDGYNPGVYIHNSGSIPLFGSVTISFDPLFVASDLVGAQPTTTINAGEVSWLIDAQPMSSSVNYKFHIEGPGIDNIFESFPFSVHVTLFDNIGTLLYENTWSYNPIIVCGYDPNDLTATPVGYTDQHYALAGDEIQYHVRFQNTGNAPAENVRIEDQLDPSIYDLSSFIFEQSSHSVSTHLDGNGLLEFYFDNIMLADSFSNEPASHGYAVYRVRLRDDLIPGTIAYNTANIYFDSNPAVITNSTFHTIFDCEMTGISLPDFVQCEGSDFNTSEYEYPLTESSIWYVDGQLYSQDDILNLTNMNAGVLLVDHHMLNPLCDVVDEFTVTVENIPVIQITPSGGVFIATSVNGTYQWFLDGQPITGADQNLYSPIAEGIYTVQVTTLTGCVATSAEQMYIGIEEVGNNQFSVYPNPATDVLTIEQFSKFEQINLISAEGRVVISWNNPAGKIQFDVSDISAGLYLVEAKDEKGEINSMKISIQ